MKNASDSRSKERDSVHVHGDRERDKEHRRCPTGLH